MACSSRSLTWLRTCSTISSSKNSFKFVKGSLRCPSLRTCSSRIRVYLLCELALQRKVRPFLFLKPILYTKDFTLPYHLTPVSDEVKQIRISMALGIVRAKIPSLIGERSFRVE